jgi:hypothetical protein
VLGLAWAARLPPRRVLARVLPVALAALAAFAWRRLALGTYGGGYPAPEGGVLSAFAEVIAALAGMIAGWARQLTVVLVLLGALLASGLLAGSADERGVLAGALCATLCFLPLFAAAPFAEQNQRLFFVGWLGLALAAGSAFARVPKQGPAAAVAGVSAALLLATSGLHAWRDTREWRDAAELGESRVAAARVAVASAGESDAPVLFRGFPLSAGGAYCLGWGVADRFRAPFPESPRPVWPLRPMFAPSREIESAVPLRSGPEPLASLWPLDDAAAVPLLRVTREGRDDFGPLVLDERVFASEVDRSDVLELAGAPEGRIELAVYTELGYESALAELGAERSTLSLKQILAAKSQTATIAESLLHAADFAGATRAFLELRSLGQAGELLAASRWIELVWRPEVVARALDGA